MNYYPFAQKADQLVALELRYDGVVRPMERAPKGGVWSDVSGVYGTLQVAKAAPLHFKVAVSPKSVGLCCIEFTGWVPPYITCRPYALGQSWSFGQDELDYAQVVNSNKDSVREINFIFKSDGSLSWTIGDGPQEDASFKLDGAKLKYAYVVLRVVGQNTGSLSVTGGAFKLADGTGRAKSKFSCE